METIQIIGYQTANGDYTKLPLFTMSVAAGIPTPVDTHIDKEIDLNEFLVDHPAATFFARVNGDSLRHHGIRDNDLLIVDTLVQPEDGRIVLTSISGELSIKIYKVVDGDVYLESSDNRFLPIKIDGYMEFILLGVVTKIIHSL